MTADIIEPLEGEPQIPGVAPPKRGRSNTRQLVAVAILMLSLVAVLGFFVSRWFGRPAGTAEKTVAAPDVASARMPTLQMPPTVAPRPPPAASTPVAVPTPVHAVPSIEATTGDAQPIPVRGTGGAPTSSSAPRKVLNPDDAPIFSSSAAPDMRAAGNAAPRVTGNPTADAQNSLDAYQRQLGGMLENLQNLAGGGSKVPAASPTPAAVAAASPAAQPNAPPLFGSMDRSATPTVQARRLADRSLVVPKGTLFLCGLKTRVVSATSGFVGCQVTRNVFSDDGRVLLIERGSHLDGEYRIVTVRPGMTRIPVLWTRVRAPNGVTVDLDSPATGELGESGLGGHVDNRWGERLGAAVLLSLVDDALKYAIAAQTSDGGNDNTVLLPNTTAQGSKLAEKVLETTIGIPPLLYQNQGGVVGVYVARDLDFSSVYELRPQ